MLSGTDGAVTYDRGSDGVVIPGSSRNRHKAVNGSTVQLTIDDDIQFFVQQQVQQAKNVSGAHDVSAVVLDAKTGDVLAMANDNTFDPSQDIGRQGDRQLGNLPVSSPYEPGSVNKIITASSVIEYGLSNPDEVLQVPGSIQMGYVKALFEPRRWYDLVPDQSHIVMTTGYGTFLTTGTVNDSDYATAAAAARAWARASR